jgi:hypothetical protein
MLQCVNLLMKTHYKFSKVTNIKRMSSNGEYKKFKIYIEMCRLTANSVYLRSNGLYH